MSHLLKAINAEAKILKASSRMMVANRALGTSSEKHLKMAANSALRLRGLFGVTERAIRLVCNVQADDPNDSGVDMSADEDHANEENQAHEDRDYYLDQNRDEGYGDDG
ncbi:hypothetical protein TYRP_017094 [Tyrophagus putrescentiae]|nr:hypothetical protein TYRP_016929 [Tyrophagus putrescentiae]KAH9401692.1 hypothetical protein TYRP_017094 [Tyrophagus putrescentiae]